MQANGRQVGIAKAITEQRFTEVTGEGGWPEMGGWRCTDCFANYTTQAEAERCIRPVSRRVHYAQRQADWWRELLRQEARDGQRRHR